MARSMPLKWHGGKSYIAQTIRALFPKHDVLVVPFLGGGSIPFSWEPEAVEVVNDLDADLMRFYAHLKNRGEWLHSMLSALQFCEASFINAKEILLSSTASDGLRACAYFAVNRMSRQAMGKHFCTPTTRLRRGMEEHLSAWLSAVDSLPYFSKRLQSVLLYCEDFLPLMKRWDTEDALFYCDPPYPSEVRVSRNVYTHEMSDERHCDLLNFLACCRGKFVLSGYQCELYSDIAEAEGWELHQLETRVASSSKRSKPTAVECLWTNF